jgi:hypothetical protein
MPEGPAGNHHGMADLVQLSLRGLDYASRPARFAVGMLLRFVRDDTPEPVRPAPEPVADHPQTRPAPAPPEPSPKAARRMLRHEPTRGQAAAIRQHQRAAEWGEPELPRP